MPSSSHHSSSLGAHFADLEKIGIQYSHDFFVLQAYSQDQWPRKLLELRDEGPSKASVELVLWPSNVEQIASIVRWARVADVNLIPYGAGSGVCGGIIPSRIDELESAHRPAVLVDLKNMRKIRSLDRQSQTVWVEAGIIGENLERHLNQEGYTLGHFPSSIYCSSLGGYLATRSAGQLSTKYGKIEDMVLSIEVVLPDGTIAQSGRAPRSAMGPDWTHLLIGTEGSLGFFSAACLQINRLPEIRIFQGYGCSQMSQAVLFSKELMQKGLKPAVMRIYDPLETSLTLNSELLRKSGFTGGAIVVVIFEGSQRLTQAEAAEAEAVAQGLELQLLGPDLGEHWWENRYKVSYQQQLILSHDRMIVDTFEIATTWDKIEKVYQAVKAVPVGWGVILAHLSHFYPTGANIYFTLVAHSGFRKSTVERYDEIWEGLLHAAFQAGASLSHHHGVGIQKNEWIRKEKGPWIDVFRKVKNGLDPENRFNPGKMGL